MGRGASERGGEGRRGERETGECVNPSVNEKCVAGHDTWQRRGQNLAWSREPLPTSPHPARPVPRHSRPMPPPSLHPNASCHNHPAPSCCIRRNPIRLVPCQLQNVASSPFPDSIRLALPYVSAVMLLLLHLPRPIQSSVTQPQAMSTVTRCLHFTSSSHAL